MGETRGETKQAKMEMEEDVDTRKTPILVGHLSQAAVDSMRLYGETPLPQRAELYEEVYRAFVGCAEPLLRGGETHHWPAWETTQYYHECVATAGASTHSSSYKTRMCRFVGEGACHFGDKCKFAHAVSELRGTQ